MIHKKRKKKMKVKNPEIKKNSKKNKMKVLNEKEENNKKYN